MIVVPLTLRRPPSYYSHGKSCKSQRYSPAKYGGDEGIIVAATTRHRMIERQFPFDGEVASRDPLGSACRLTFVRQACLRSFVRLRQSRILAHATSDANSGQRVAGHTFRSRRSETPSRWCQSELQSHDRHRRHPVNLASTRSRWTSGQSSCLPGWFR